MEYDRPRLDSLLLTVTNVLKTCEKKHHFLSRQSELCYLSAFHYGSPSNWWIGPWKASAKPQGRVSASGIAGAGDQSGLK